jgi:DNA-binding transcriptional ArsR family regulator
MVSQEQGIDRGLRALADTTRRGILILLQGSQLSVLEIAEKFPMSRPAISKHLRILKEAGLVLETPAGRQRLYSLQSGPLESLQRWLAELDGLAKPTARSRLGSNPPGATAVPRSPEPDASWRVW